MPVTCGESHHTKFSLWGPRAWGHCNPFHSLLIDQGQNKQGLQCVGCVAIIKPSCKLSAILIIPLIGMILGGLRMYFMSIHLAMALAILFLPFKYHENTKMCYVGLHYIHYELHKGGNCMRLSHTACIKVLP